MSFKSKINIDQVPNHVAIIMDGNGRWAKNQGQPRAYGHLNGVGGVRESLTAASEIGIKYLTLYAFSTENWDRPPAEVEALMDLLVQTIIKELEGLQENQVRLQVIGDMDKLPKNCSNALSDAVERTKNNTRITLVLALSYSARWEITEAVKQLSQDVKKGEITPEDINQTTICQYLQTRNIPDPELLIRTSGEMRISNFLLWQIAYSELYFTETLWPDFKKEDFFEAVLAFQTRERRFGKISEQIRS